MSAPEHLVESAAALAPEAVSPAPSPERGVDILTFGCRLNTYESEVMRGHATGLDDLIIVNTCAVTGEAERQARQAIRRAHRERPGARIVVTGCAAQIDPDRWSALPGVTRVLGNEDKLKAESWTPTALTQGNAVSDIMAARETAGHLVTEFAGRTRAFVEVQQGCDHRCTFCIIPFGRGPSRSAPVGAVVEQVRALVASGYREVVLTGVDITSWGGDLPGTPRLGQLCRRLLALVPELERLRLSSVDPVEIDDDIWRLLESEPRFMPYLHLSLQAGSDMILKRMKRRHLVEDAARVIERARAIRPRIGIGADLIAGFPTEDDVLFEETLAFVEQASLPFLHVFPYSARPGTPAARMPAVQVIERKARAARIRALGEAAAQAYYRSLIGQELSVLMETADSGHSEEFAPVRLTKPSEIGRIERVRAVAVDAGGVVAETI
ncbi:tRNA 2-methylthioadenosine synthase MiaB [Acetobacter nitrogenifigens DSM 23921 = NBRC 105050]|uniref:tRNA (N(6)-L-threonylcarbamoyladenosine(37)-C(2) )-methylthiotransferase MtaB n=1 Tax=Acetobacter nitrogenifigens DSM 23921 = NBRC 105050 TaxID=1120919 RepID=A0A511X7U8_9PROT|nr:tRNA (N(6)-L-threonylcarbamoyladenosine(37)-C(2))-methylthiotransferase MtaB [Acetobacter nitrogenifigens]GBQ88963.1 tRNA 2-methylthioadenosine synthase MiaB [Acetobacter nitrogenifigens DSM 23921 = NBRC 105050]GEN59026.1 tRNA (N(6)-L-threonylcarbamoyladenosine(37)-C(2))-methylthiotransferase MtaB [Acetobacter nitrogenifigens DSM 23921 = NBRC 105050]